MIKHRHIGHDWQFSKKQQDKLRQYYDTNKLLVDCLNSDCYVSRAVRDEISETLLSPTAEAKQSKRCLRVSGGGVWGVGIPYPQGDRA